MRQLFACRVCDVKACDVCSVLKMRCPKRILVLGGEG